MLLWVFQESFFPFDRPRQVCLGNHVFFDQPISQDRYVLTMEEVKNAVVDPPAADAQFVDVFFQIVSQWTAEFVAELGQQADAYDYIVK